VCWPGLHVIYACYIASYIGRPYRERGGHEGCNMDLIGLSGKERSALEQFSGLVS